MSGVPPEFIRDTRSPLRRLLGDGPAPHAVLDDFAGVGGRFRGQPLALVAVAADAEVEALAAAVKWLTALDGLTREDLLTPAGEEALRFALKCELLFRALRDPADVTRPLAESPAELRALLFPEEIHALHARYQSHQLDRSPITRARTWEEVRARVEATGKGSMAPTWLSSCDFATLVLIITELASQRYGPTRPPSSGTSTPNS